MEREKLIKQIERAQAHAAEHDHHSVSGKPEMAARAGREKPDRGDLMEREAEDIEASEDADVRKFKEQDRIKPAT